jgi:hypothetical protein
MSNILAQNLSLVRRRRDQIARRKKSSRSLLLAKDPSHNSANGEEFDHDQGSPSWATLEGDLDFPMDGAGPSVVNNDPPEPPSPPSVPLGGDADEYGLSNLRRSRRVAECVEKIGRFRWSSKNHHREFIMDDDDDEENHEEDEDAEGNPLTQEDEVMEDEGFVNSDDDSQEDDDEYDTPFAEPGQEGISVWDLLGESFLKEASQLGASALIHSFIDA